LTLPKLLCCPDLQAACWSSCQSNTVAQPSWSVIALVLDRGQTKLIGFDNPGFS
jgi:hypothetical protein